MQRRPYRKCCKFARIGLRTAFLTGLGSYADTYSLRL